MQSLRGGCSIVTVGRFGLEDMGVLGWVIALEIPSTRHMPELWRAPAMTGWWRTPDSLGDSRRARDPAGRGGAEDVESYYV